MSDWAQVAEDFILMNNVLFDFAEVSTLHM